MADIIDSNLLFPTAPREKDVYKKNVQKDKIKSKETTNVLKPAVNHSFPSLSATSDRKHTSKTYRSLKFQDDTESLEILGSLVSIDGSDDQNKQTKPFYKRRLKAKSKTLKLIGFGVVLNILSTIRDKLRPKDVDEESLIFASEESAKRENKTRKKIHKNKEKTKGKSRRRRVKKVTSRSCKIVSKCLFSMTTVPNYYLSGPMHVCANYDQENIYQVTKKNTKK